MVRTCYRRQTLGLFVALSAFAASTTAPAEYPVAGVKPYERPAHAPAITQVKKNKAWYDQALTGLEPPYPESFRFLEDQGNWYTPFNRPGMTGPYDIRGWHQ